MQHKRIVKDLNILKNFKYYINSIINVARTFSYPNEHTPEFIEMMQDFINENSTLTEFADLYTSSNFTINFEDTCDTNYNYKDNFKIITFIPDISYCIKLVEYLRGDESNFDKF